MPSENILLANIILVVVAIVLSLIAIYYYSKGNKKFLTGEFKTYASWKLFGVVVYTIHLFAHLVEEANEIGWINVNENVVSLTLYIFLAIAGAFFLGGSYFYLKLSKIIGYKK